MNIATRKVIKIFALVILLLVVIGFGYGVYWNSRVTKRESVSGLEYKITRRTLSNKDFQLVVKKVKPEEVPQRGPNGSVLNDGKEWSYQNISEIKKNKNGIDFVRFYQEACYSDRIEPKLDPNFGNGKQLISCSDTWGSELTTYFVYVGNEIYSFSTPFPTRILYHDPYFGALPERISAKDFQALIESLKR